MAGATGLRYTGKVKTFNTTTGFGFIQCPKLFEQYGQDVYLHKGALEHSGLDPNAITVGAMVSFEVYVSAKGAPQANTIKVVSPRGSAPVASSPNAASPNKGNSHSSGGGSKGKSGGTWANSKGGSDGYWRKGSSDGSWSKGGGSWDSKGGSSSWGKGGGDNWGKNGGAAASGKSHEKGCGKKTGKTSWSKPAPKKVLPPDSSKPAPKPVLRPPPIKASALNEALTKAVGEAAVTSVGGFADDGTPMVSLSLATLNKLLKAAGGESVEGSPDSIPDESEGLRGFDGSEVVGPWFSGTLKEYLADQAFGYIDSPVFKEQFGEKELFVHADHLDPDGSGELVAEEGEEVLFPLVEDEEGNAWAWSPVIRKARSFLGSIKSWSGGYGFIKCETLSPVFAEDIYVHGAAAEYGGCQTHVGAPVVFNLHVNKEGKPQASSPRPPGVKLDDLPGGSKADRTRVDNSDRGPAPEAKKRKVEAAAPQSRKELSEEEKDNWYSGEVKSYNPDKGFGFIDCTELREQFGRDVFLHRAVFEESGAAVGHLVSFQITLNAMSQPQASKLMVEGGGAESGDALDEDVTGDAPDEGEQDEGA